MLLMLLDHGLVRLLGSFIGLQLLVPVFTVSLLALRPAGRRRSAILVVVRCVRADVGPQAGSRKAGVANRVGSCIMVCVVLLEGLVVLGMGVMLMGRWWLDVVVHHLGHTTSTGDAI